MAFNRRYLQGNESTRFPNSCLVFDTETYPIADPHNSKRNLHRLRLWSAIAWRFEKGNVTRRKVTYGVESATFWQFVLERTNPYKPLYCFAHNVGFDLTTLRFWRELDARRLSVVQPAGWRGNDDSLREQTSRLGMLCLNDPPTIIECWVSGTRRRIVFLDSMNYWRCGLEELGQELGLPKHNMPEFTASDAEWMEYCIRDSLILEKAINSLEVFIREHDCGVFKYTIGSQALASFKHAHMRHKIVLHREEYPLALEREAYRGGEVRMGYCGRIVLAGGMSDLATSDDTLDNLPERSGPVYVLDCQSFYPSVMRTNLFPCELCGSVVEPELDSLGSLAARYYLIAEVGVKTESYTYPVKIDGRSINATGEFRTVLCGIELVNAIVRKHVTWVGRVNYYNQAKLFESFVNYWFVQRQKANLAGKTETEAMIKCLMNSLFGKFGQRAERWPDRRNQPAIRPWGTYWDWDEETGDYQFFRSIAGRVQVNLPGGESAESFPAIAAAVTSYGRERMERMRDVAGQGNWYYQDTDSLHVNQEGYNRLCSCRLIVPGEVGKLKVEGIYQTAEYRGIKDYSLDGTRVIAGIKRSAVEVDRDTFTQLEFQRLSSVLSSVPHDGVFVTEKTVEVSHSLPPGRVLPDGTVLPPVLP